MSKIGCCDQSLNAAIMALTALANSMIVQSLVTINS